VKSRTSTGRTTTGLVAIVLAIAVSIGFMLVPAVANAGPSYPTVNENAYVTNGTVRAIVNYNGITYIGGDFTQVGPVGGPMQDRNRIAALDATGTATSWNPNADNTVYALAVSGSTVYAGGDFGNIGGAARNYIAALDTTVDTNNATDWDPDADYTVYALALSGSTVYAGGDFSCFKSSGDNPITRNYIAALSSSGTVKDWDPDADSTVYALAVSGSTVYAGGDFSCFKSSGDNCITRNYIAALSSSGTVKTWDPDADYTVYALAVSGSTVYAGGDFSCFKSSGDNPITRNFIAALDATGAATSWDPDADGSVYALAVSGSTVYVGGDFSCFKSSGDNPITRNFIAALDATGAATSWDPDADGSVYALAVSGSTVYAGGDFTTIGGEENRSYFAQFDLGSQNPDPTTSSISPTGKAAGQPGFTLTVNGTKFVDGLSQVRWNGSARTTRYMSDTQLTADISASDIATVGSAKVTVYNAGAANPESNPQTFTINTGSVTDPTITSLDPRSKAKGQPGFTLTVNGTNFVDGLSVVRWNGSARTTHCTSARVLKADIPASDVATVGSARVTVYNAGAANPESNPQTFTINTAPNPTVTSLDPKSKVAGQPGFTLTVNGTKFVDGLSQVRWNDSARTTRYVSDTQITADIPASDIAAVGSARVTVLNAGATVSRSKTFHIKRPSRPTITGISPTSRYTGQPIFTLTVNGAHFVDGLSQVLWNGSARTTHYTSAKVLTADIPASDIATAGTAIVTVYNAGAGTPESKKAQMLTIKIAPNPTITSISPTGSVAGQPAFTLTVSGTNFVDGVSVVQWNGSARTAHFSSATLLMADIPATDIASAGTASVTVYNAGAPTPESNAQTFTINAPTKPTITSISPTHMCAGQPGFTLTVNGTNFLDGLSVVQWKGAARTTHYVSATQITADIPASDIAAVGYVKVTVLNPGATVSNYRTFSIRRPSRPTISSISPASKAAGQTGFTLTVNGNYYLDGISVVRWNGVARATTFVSKTQLKAEISASDIATAGTAIVTVYNAGAGTPESIAKTFTITP